ncbi:MAG: hypothetical protein M3P04_07940 [Actinomycetota bacterium]|nr:hypothetical protein [Actinomycetota bacterium]
MTAIRQLTTALALAVLAVAAATQQTRSVDLANPFYCAVVNDGQGNPVYTACVPAP